MLTASAPLLAVKEEPKGWNHDSGQDLVVFEAISAMVVCKSAAKHPLAWPMTWSPFGWPLHILPGSSLQDMDGVGWEGGIRLVPLALHSPVHDLLSLSPNY